MAAIHRLKKQGPLDVWSIRERLCLASSVMRSGDQNWVSVSRAIKPFGELSRLPDWFSQKNCALQYSDLLEKVEKPKRKRSSDRGDIETPGDQIVRKLTVERIEELKGIIQNEQLQYRNLKRDVKMVKSGHVDNQLQEMWTKIQEQEKAAREALAAEAVRLAQEAASRAQAQAVAKALRPPGSVGKPKKLPPHFRYGQNRRNSTQSEQSEQESAAESPDISVEVVEEESNQSDIVVPMAVTTPSSAHPVSVNKPKTPPTSPLLTSLLKNHSQPSCTMPIKNEFQDVIDEVTSIASSSSLKTNTISTSLDLNLMSSSEISEAIVMTPKSSFIAPEVSTPITPITSTPVKIFPPVQVLTSPSAGAPTLSKLLGAPPITNPKIQTPSPIPIETPATTPQLITTSLESVTALIEPAEPMECSEIEPTSQRSEDSTIVSTIISPSVESAEVMTPIENIETIMTPKIEPISVLEPVSVKINVEPEPTTEIKVETIKEEPMEICENVPTTEQIEASSVGPTDKETDQKQLDSAMEVNEEKEKEGIGDEALMSIVQVDQIPKTEETVDKNIEGSEVKMEVEHSSINETESVIKESQPASPASSESSKISDGSNKPVKKKVGRKRKIRKFPRNKSSKTLPEDEKEEEKSTDGTTSTAPSTPTTSSPLTTATVSTTVDTTTASTSLTTINSIVVATAIADITVPAPSITETISNENSTSTTSKDSIAQFTLPTPDTISISTSTITSDANVPTSTDSCDASKPQLTTSDSTTQPPTTDPGLSTVTTTNTTTSTIPSSEFCVPLESESNKEEHTQSEGPMSSDEDQTIPDSDDMSNLEKSRSLSITDSIPNSPASLFKDEESQKDYKSWKKAIMLVWRAAANHKFANVFLHPVTDEVAPGYHSIVYRPMDLSVVKKNIEIGVIRTTSEFQRDVMLMFQNAIMYNNSDHDVYHMAIEMQKEVIRIIQDFLTTQLMLQTTETKVLRIREHSSRRSDSSEKRSASLPSEDFVASVESSKTSDKEVLGQNVIPGQLDNFSLE